MADIYEVRTFKDIYKAILEELKVQESDTVTLNRIKRDINMEYLNEIIPYSDWTWIKDKISLVHKAYYNTGTVNVTKDSNSITFSSAPSESQTGNLFFTTGYNEIYTIKSHTAGSTTATLNTKYNGTSNSTSAFKIILDGIPLPNDLIDTTKVYHDHNKYSMDALGSTEFLELSLNSRRREGFPEYYSITEYEEPEKYLTISGLPALSTRASSGLIRTLVFASDVSSILNEGESIEISSAGDDNYNGEYIIESISTTIVKYIGKEKLTESATSDGTLIVKTKDTSNTFERYRKLKVYPDINNVDINLHLEYTKRIVPLKEDTDEPIIPIQDRIVLIYAALSKAWSRMRNPEEALRNFQLFDRKISKMVSKQPDSRDLPKMKMNSIYLAAKRTNNRLKKFKDF
ncbi:MAG: hypothetical protein GTN36_05495 [Candidatus Aenigmarchaeota archaeon]|nr:hypothetical protein [Candidatus Aenigmarchaeota archaeon]